MNNTENKGEIKFCLFDVFPAINLLLFSFIHSVYYQSGS